MPLLTHCAGNIASWKVKVGDEIGAGDSIAEVETDKATMDWESQEEGYLAAILADEGAKDIPVGTPMAVMVDDKVTRAVLRPGLSRSIRRVQLASVFRVSHAAKAPTSLQCSPHTA